MMAQAGSRCGSWVVSTPETALRSAGDLVDVGCCRTPEGDASPERIGRCRTTPHSAGIPDGAPRLAELRLRGVRRAARQRRGRRRARSPTRACSRSRRRPRGRGAMRARTAGTATGSGRSRRPCATRREGPSPRSSPAATWQVRRSQSGSRYGTGSRSRPVSLVSAGSGSTGSHLGRRSSARREIGPKSRFFGPIPAEMGGNWPKKEPQAGPSPTAKSLETSETQGWRAPGSHPGGRRFESG
jgi:hypothetical protein